MNDKVIGLGALIVMWLLSEAAPDDLKPFAGITGLAIATILLIRMRK